jgi:hypothetical protein
MSATSSANGVCGFFVNHLGGKWSADTPVARVPSTSSTTRHSRCGQAVSVVIP